jgi:ABC-2 type transport system permease protein
VNRRRILTVARTDLRQLRQSPDFWVPMMILAGFFFVVAPAVLLSLITAAETSPAIQRVATAVDVLPSAARAAVEGKTSDAAGQTSYALAVYLFAPLAVIVPMTISTAVGANTLVGEKERGTGEFLAHSPASDRELYLGKLIASLVPGYLTTMVGFGVYSLIVNLIVGPRVGGWFFPTSEWWVLMVWVVPPFLALTLSVVLRLSARVKSSAAAQQASGLVTLPLIMVSYAQSSGFIFGTTASGIGIGLLVWVAAAVGLARGARAVTRPRLLGIDGRL